eukprot:4883798-Lingulodinium_polyedra.AAC.1
MARAMASCWRAASSWSVASWGSSSGGCRSALAPAAAPRGLFGQLVTLPSASMYMSWAESRRLPQLRHSA